MNYRLRHIIPLFVLLAFGFDTTRSAPLKSPRKPPTFFVLVVVDQFITDFFYRYEDEYTGGLKKLRDNSAFFPMAQHRHVPTETAPGHASIITGLPPQNTGIIGNDWYDRNQGKRIYSFYDPNHGLSPVNLLVPTLGDLLKNKNSKSKVVALSFKDRSAIILGGHHADAVVWFDKKWRRFTSSGYYGSSPPWLDMVNDRLKSRIPWWPKFLFALVSPEVDRWLWETAKSAIAYYHLGEDEHPDLLAISFSATDNIGHRYGPDGEEMHRQLIHLDRILNELITAVDEASRSRLALILTSDHGVFPLPEVSSGKKLGAKRIKKRNFKASIKDAIKEAYPAGPWVLEILIPDIYFHRTEIEKAGINWEEFLTKAAGKIRSLEAVAQVYTPPSFGEEDEFTPIYKRSYFPGRSGDLLIRLKEEILMSDWEKGTTHGSPYRYDTEVPLLFFGPSFTNNTFQDAVNIENMAPTLGWMWGVSYRTNGDNRILHEIFKENGIK